MKIAKDGLESISLAVPMASSLLLQHLPITPPPEPIPKTESRKRNVMDHLSLSSSEFGDFSLSEEARKKQILDHVRKSQT